MGVAHVGLVHRDSCGCKSKGFRAVSSYVRKVKRHSQGLRQCARCLQHRPLVIDVTDQNTLKDQKREQYKRLNK